MNEYFKSNATGNIFQVVRRENGYVVTDRIGYVDSDGDFVKRAGIGFTMREDIFAESALVEMVRTIGDVFYTAEDWTEVEIIRAER